MTTQVDEHVAPGPGWLRLRRGPLLLLPPELDRLVRLHVTDAPEEEEEEEEEAAAYVQ